MYPAHLAPAVQGRRRHAQVPRQVGQQPLPLVQQTCGRQGHGPWTTAAILGQETGHHVFAETCRPFGRVKALLVQALRYRGHRLPLRTQRGDPRTQAGVVRQLLVALHGTRQAVVADKTTRPADGHLNLIRLPLHADLDLFDQKADEALPLRRRGRLGMPQLGDVPCQRADLLLLRRGERSRLAATETLVLFGQARLLGKCFFPATLQRARDQAVLWLHGLILPGRTPGLIAGTFELLLPVLVQTPPLLGHIGGRGQVQLQGRRLQDVQDLSADQGIQSLAGQALTRQLAIVDVAAQATVAEPASCVGVTDQQVTTAMGTDEQAAQQRRPVARTPQAGGPVGLETLLVSPVALGCDVGRAATFEQDQALLGRADRPPRPWTTGHLTPRVTRTVAPAVVP